MNFNEKITKKVDISNNDGLSSFLDMYAQQHHNTYEVFYFFLKKIKPKRILEIGTALGGFTKFLKFVSNELELNFDIQSYDIIEMNYYKDMIKEGIDIRVENIFSDNYSIVKQEVINFIQKDGVSLILCDGGNKVKEFNILSNYIKVGDYIMAHDYTDTRESFDENIRGKIWNWHEISESNIAESCEKNNLNYYNKDAFDQIVWVCKLKER